MVRCLLLIGLLANVNSTAVSETPEWFREARMCNHWLWPAEYASNLYSRAELEKEISWVASAGFQMRNGTAKSSAQKAEIFGK